MQQDPRVKSVPLCMVETSALEIFSACLKILQDTHSWESLRAEFPQISAQLSSLYPQLISDIQTHGDSCYGYKRLKLWTHQSQNPLHVMSLVGFVFRVDGKHVLNLHLYNTEGSPNKTCYSEPPPSQSSNKMQTSVHDHNCLCLSHVAFIEDGLQVIESFYEMTADGIKKIHSVERIPEQACLDSGEGPYIHQVEIIKGVL